MSTTYYIINEKIKENKKVEHENLLNLINKVDNIVNVYCVEGKLSTDTLDDIQNSLSTWKWFVDKEDGYYRFLQTTATSYTFYKCYDEGNVYEPYQDIDNLRQALDFVEHNDDYNIYDEYGEHIEVDRIKHIIKNRLGMY